MPSGIAVEIETVGEKPAPFDDIKIGGEIQYLESVGTLKDYKFSGGTDDFAVLNESLAKAVAQNDTSVLWIHGAQPVTEGKSQSLQTQLNLGLNRPVLFDLQIVAGPNELFNGLNKHRNLVRVPRTGSLKDDLISLFRTCGTSKASPSILDDVEYVDCTAVDQAQLVNPNCHLNSIIAAIIANALRVTSLFYLEAGVISVPVQYAVIVHEGTGAAAFLFLAIFIILSAESFAEGTGNDKLQSNTPVSQTAHSNRLRQISFLAVCIIAAILPFFQQTQEPVSVTSTTSPSNWPTRFHGRILQPLPLSAVDARFASGFPGEIAMFTTTTEPQIIIYRRINQATRQLHPAADCYLASGYEIKFLPQHRDRAGHQWNSILATSKSARLQIQERITDISGQTWTDVSAWYWSAVLGKSTRPWLSETVIEKVKR